MAKAEKEICSDKGEMKDKNRGWNLQMAQHLQYGMIWYGSENPWFSACYLSIEIDFLICMWYIYNIKIEIYHIRKGGDFVKKINYLGMLSLLSLIAILGWKTGNTGLYGFLALPITFVIFGLFPMSCSNRMFRNLLLLPFCRNDFSCSVYVYLFNALRYFFFYPYGFWVKFCCCYLHIYDYFNDTGMERAKRGAGMIKTGLRSTEPDMIWNKRI